MIKYVVSALAALAIIGLASAGHAHAAPLSPVEHSIAINRVAICNALTNYGTNAVEIVGVALMSTPDDLTLDQAAEVIVKSVASTCPNQLPTLAAFVEQHNGTLA